MSEFQSIGQAAARVVAGLSDVQGRSRLEIWPVTDRASWLARRTKDVTASAAGAVLGCHEFITPYELHCLKAGLITEDPEQTPAMERGTLLEPVAIELIKRRYPTWHVEQPGKYYRDPVVRLGATPDLFAVDPDRVGLGVVQIKNCEPSVFRRKWRGENGEIEVPLWIAVQALIEAHLTAASWAAVAVLRVGYGLDLDLIEIPLHRPLIAKVETEVQAFWRGVEAGQPPDPDLIRDGALIEVLYVPSGETVDLSGDNLAVELADEREQMSDAQKAAKVRLGEIKAELLLKLGGASAGRLADGRLITANRINRGSYEVGPSSYMDLRIKKGKAA
jgi:hypothetical protein